MKRGGFRLNAGRPKGMGPHGEATKPVRIPISMVEDVIGYINSKGYRLPLYASKVQAGFPSPADDQIESKLDLNEHLIHHPAATFFVRATGDSMINAGIHEEDILIVDRSIEPSHNKIVIAAVDGNLTVKRLSIKPEGRHLMPENNAHKPIIITENNDVHIWGVVTAVIHKPV